MIFDTGLPNPQRSTIIANIVERLEPLSKRAGGYLHAVALLGRTIRSTEDDLGLGMLLEVLNGRAPAIGIATGRRRFTPGGSSDRATSDIEVELYAVGNSQRSTPARLVGDGAPAPNDPGVFTILEHSLELLVGWSPLGHPMRPVEEDEIATLEEVVIWRQLYTVRTETRVDLKRERREYVREIETTLRTDPSAAAVLVELTENPP